MPGIGGLSTGCYAQMNGYRATILEMHAVPGGVCTSWKRHGYTFDGCIHNLAGTTPHSAFHGMWHELGVVPAIQMRAYDELVRVERPDGEPLIVHTDLDRLERHLKQLAPADAAVIDELIGAARQFVRFDLLGLALASPLERARALACCRCSSSTAASRWSNSRSASPTRSCAAPSRRWSTTGLRSR